MKFLVFNVAVVLALGFLFIGKPAEIRHASDKVLKVVGDIKERMTGDYGAKGSKEEKSVAKPSSEKTSVKRKVEKLRKVLHEDNAEVSLRSVEADQKVKPPPPSVSKGTDPQKVNRKGREETVAATSGKQSPVRIRTDDLLKSLRDQGAAVPARSIEKVQKVASVANGLNREAGAEKVTSTLTEARETSKPKNGKDLRTRTKRDSHREKEARKNYSEVHKILAKKPLPASNPVASDGNGFMSASDRRRELMTLADDMELAHAQSLGNQ